MPDSQWMKILKDSDIQFVAGVASLIFLAAYWVTGWPQNIPWWVTTIAWVVLLFSGVSLALKLFGAWIGAR